MSIEKAYQLSDELCDAGDRKNSRIIGAVAGMAEVRGRIIEELASICREKSGAKRKHRLEILLRDHPDEDCLSMARLQAREFKI